MNTAIVRSVATVSLLLAWGCARALGLGPATVNSDLSAPLHVDIPITNLAGSGVDPDALVVDVPGFNEHARLGFPEPVIPAGLVVTVLRDAAGGARLRLSTQRAAREPVLRFLLRASWPGGSTVREYTLLLDLPAAARPARASAPAAVATASARPQSPPPRGSLAGNPFQAPAAARAGSPYGPVALGDTLHAIIASAYSARASDAMARAIVARNPHAFTNGDPDRLLLGATLELPPVAQLAGSAAPGAGRASSSAAPAATATAPRTATAPQRVVRPGDTLYAIARTLPDASAARLAGVVQRLYERNPQAFIDGDINRLRVGASLTLDETATASATSPPRATTADVGAPATDTAASAQETARLQSELAQAQGVVASERERELTLRERLARMEREVASLRERDTALTAATQSLRARLAAAATSPSPAATQPAAAPQSAPGTRPVTAPAAAQPAATTAPAARPVPAPPARAPATSPDLPLTWLAAGALVLLALLALLVVSMRRNRARVDASHAAPHPRHVDDEATQRRLAAVRDAHANRTNGSQGNDMRTKSAGTTANVRLTDTARASALAKEAAVHLAYGDHAAAHTSIVEAIRLAPHQDEHKMMLMTVYQAMGRHDSARAIVDELLNRREQLSGEVRAQVEQHAQRQSR